MEEVQLYLSMQSFDIEGDEDGVNFTDSWAMANKNNKGFSSWPLSYGNWTTTNPHNPLYVTAQVVLDASVAHLAATQYAPSELC